MRLCRREFLVAAAGALAAIALARRLPALPPPLALAPDPWLRGAAGACSGAAERAARAGGQAYHQ